MNGAENEAMLAMKTIIVAEITEVEICGITIFAKVVNLLAPRIFDASKISASSFFNEFEMKRKKYG
jgi:hypothetical protein